MKPYYQDDACTIYHGDCREILPSLPKVDLVLTDPPYGIKADNRKRILSRANASNATDYGESDWDSSPPTQEDIQGCISRGHSAIIWGGNYWTQVPSAAWLVWDKQNTGDFADCELAWTNLEQAIRIFRFTWNGMIRAGEARGVKRLHPTQKPLELMTWCLSFVPEAQTILDPFMGSGTTLRAAKDLGRRSIGIEICEEYCEIAARRLAQEVLPFSEIPRTYNITENKNEFQFA